MFHSLFLIAFTALFQFLSGDYLNIFISVMEHMMPLIHNYNFLYILVG